VNIETSSSGADEAHLFLHNMCIDEHHSELAEYYINWLGSQP